MEHNTDMIDQYEIGIDELGTEITSHLDSTSNRKIETDWMRKFYESLPNLSGQYK